MEQAQFRKKPLIILEFNLPVKYFKSVTSHQNIWIIFSDKAYLSI